MITEIIDFVRYRPGSHVLVVATDRRRGTGFMLSLARANRQDGQEMTHRRLKFPNGSVVEVFFANEHPHFDDLRGKVLDRVYFMPGAHLSQDIIDQVLRPAMAGRQGAVVSF